MGRVNRYTVGGAGNKWDEWEEYNGPCLFLLSDCLPVIFHVFFGFQVNTCMSVRDAHTRGVEITCLSFSYDNNSVLSRANDETLKLWDLRQFKKPILSTSGLFSKFSKLVSSLYFLHFTNCLYVWWESFDDGRHFVFLLQYGLFV